MSLKAQMQEVLDLQLLYSSQNTEDMRSRGLLIRDGIPRQISALGQSLADAARIPAGELIIEGRDATGLKSEVPWVRIASRRVSPRATAGWYVVFLFRRDGAGVYLVLAHGSTTPQAGAFIPRGNSELADLMRWGRDALEHDISSIPDLLLEVSLATRQAVPKAYEKSSLVAFYYPSQAIPSDARLQHDLGTMMRLLGKVYEADRLGKTPHSRPPEERDLEIAISQIIQSNRPLAGQGFNLSVPQRRAIELHAMNVAIKHLEKLGFSVRDVSASESFDLVATTSSETITVEVKGTTGLPGSIILTANEASHHRSQYPQNALIVVYNIELGEGNGRPVAFGGAISEVRPWLLDEDRLRPVAFTYGLGTN